MFIQTYMPKVAPFTVIKFTKDGFHHIKENAEKLGVWMALDGVDAKDLDEGVEYVVLIGSKQTAVAPLDKFNLNFYLIEEAPLDVKTQNEEELPESEEGLFQQ